MRNKAIVYTVAFLAIIIVFIGGYYSAIIFSGDDNDLISRDDNDLNERFLPTTMQENHGEIQPIRDDPYLIHGNIGNIIEDELGVLLEVDIPMYENFEQSFFRYATRGFHLSLFQEEAIINTANKKEEEGLVVTIDEDSATTVSDHTILEEGDLVLMRMRRPSREVVEESNFYITELWKIIENDDNNNSDN